MFQTKIVGFKKEWKSIYWSYQFDLGWPCQS